MVITKTLLLNAVSVFVLWYTIVLITCSVDVLIIAYEFYLSNAVQGFSTVGINTCEIRELS